MKESITGLDRLIELTLNVKRIPSGFSKESEGFLFS